MLRLVRQLPKLGTIFFVAACLSISLTPSRPATALSSSDFIPGHIIDDGIFTNSNSMTVQDIQNFLNAKVPTCSTNHTGFTGGSGTVYNPPFVCLKDFYENPNSTYTVGFNYTDTNGNAQTGSRTYYNNNAYKVTALCPVYGGYSGTPTCGSGDYHNGLDHLIPTLQTSGLSTPSGGESAAQIIYNAAQQYSINPQVLVVLLQKEQGLVTDTWPAYYEYQEATGYGCPDTAPCSSNYAGFSNQVITAAWQFRQYLNYPNNYNYVVGSNYIQYNPDSRCGGSTVNIQNQATAALYDYTPYQPNSYAIGGGTSSAYPSCGAFGNLNFWNYFNSWFGSTFAPPYYAVYSQQSSYPQVSAGTSAPVYLMYKNLGKVVWYDDVSLGSAPSGTYPVHLATSHSLNRASSFSAGWPANNRPANTFAAVYESDGTTLASNQHVVQPGQIAKFSFNLTPPADLAPGTYTEYFQPIAEGSASGMFPDTTTYLNITVNPTPSTSWSGQSPYPTIAPSQSSPSTLTIKNSGNVPLYDDVSIASAPSGSYPLHLATTNPVNRCSDFSASWSSCNRVATTFSAVYKSDGATLAANQHVAQPGEIIKFNFNFTVPAGYANGSYQEYLQPILEGTPDGGLPNLGIFYTLTVPQTPAITYTQIPSALTLSANQPQQLTYKISNSGNSTLPATSLVYTDNGAAFQTSSWQSDSTISSLGTDVAAGQTTTFTVPVLAPSAAGAYSVHLSVVNNGSTSALPGSSITFNTNVAPPVYQATYSAESGAPSFTYNQTANVFFSYKNTGNQPWYDDASIGSADWRNAHPIHLATSQPLNRSSGFAWGWPANNRPANTFSAVYESDGTTLASNQHVVQPGQIAKFSFATTPQAWVGAGVTREFFQPVAEGTSNGAFNNPGTFLDFTVLPYVFHAVYSTESASPSLTTGQTATIFFSYKNDGSAPWFDDSSLSTAPSPQKAYPVHLATSHSLNRSSVFVDASWATNNRPTFSFTSVYESDGTTLVSNQHVVQPGQIAKFSFVIHVPTGQAPGTYREFFQPVAEGTSNGAFNDPWTFLDISVH